MKSIFLSMFLKLHIYTDLLFFLFRKPFDTRFVKRISGSHDGPDNNALRAIVFPANRIRLTFRFRRTSRAIGPVETVRHRF